MHPVRFRTHYTPTSVGALMDPEFLRHAVNDMVATTDADEGRAPAGRARWQVCKARAAAWVTAVIAGRVVRR